MFTFVGTIGGESAQITYERGRFYGTRIAEILAKDAFSIREGVFVGIVGAISSNDHIKNPYAAFEILRSIFDEPPAQIGGLNVDLGDMSGGILG